MAMQDNLFEDNDMKGKTIDQIMASYIPFDPPDQLLQESVQQNIENEDGESNEHSKR